MSHLAIILLLGGSLVGCYLFLMVLIKLGELDKLERAIYIADKKLKFIRKLNKWSTEEQSASFERGIDPYDVWSSIDMAARRGYISLKREIEREGSIQEI